MRCYYFVDGERKGPVDAAQLKNLAASGKISKETEIELEDGRRIQARKVKGLLFGSETSNESADAGDVYGVAEPVVPPVLSPPSAESSAPFDEADSRYDRWPDAPEPAPLAETPKRGKLGARVVLLALSAVFLAAALAAAIVGCAQLSKTQTVSYRGQGVIGETAGLAAPNAERLDQLDDERESRMKLYENFIDKGLMDTEGDWVAYRSRAIWQTAVLADARRRPSASAETYMDALERLDFRRHEFVGGDAFNYEANASLFTGLATLGVGYDVRDVGERVQAVGSDVRGVGERVRAVGTEVRSASAVIAAGAGFVCAALFAATAALLFAATFFLPQARN